MTRVQTTAGIQARRTAGRRLPSGAVLVSRTSRWGNPFTIESILASGDAATHGEARAIAVRRHQAWLDGEGPDTYRISSRLRVSEPLVNDQIGQLTGRVLACPWPVDELLCTIGEGWRDPAGPSLVTTSHVHRHDRCRHPHPLDPARVRLAVMGEPQFGYGMDGRPLWSSRDRDAEAIRQVLRRAGFRDVGERYLDGFAVEGASASEDGAEPFAVAYCGEFDASVLARYRTALEQAGFQVNADDSDENCLLVQRSPGSRIQTLAGPGRRFLVAAAVCAVSPRRRWSRRGSERVVSGWPVGWGRRSSVRQQRCWPGCGIGVGSMQSSCEPESGSAARNHQMRARWPRCSERADAVGEVPYAGQAVAAVAGEQVPG
ncbi:DUF4326 domain-containing protein [Kribbella sp. NPDC023972]|uniref:DUF4326 domain-containing protein n=1 Tax=Kribbella sp. NPDC023972 TaxID=3154795 RepID=UPI0034021A3E